MRGTISLLTALGVTACGGNRSTEGNLPPATQAREEQQPTAPLTGLALADHYKACIGLINDAKFDDFKKDCVDAKYRGHAVAGRPEVTGADKLVGYFQTMKSAMPDWKLQPQLIMVSGRNILAVLMVTGTHTAALKTPTRDVPATNKKFGQLMFHRLTIAETNKATDEWAYVDEATMLAQLGVAPKGTPPKRAALEQGWSGAPIIALPTDDAKESANLGLVKQGNEAFIANKPDELLAIYSDDIIDMSPHSDKDIHGKTELLKGFTSFRNAWSTVKVPTLEAWAAGDYVVQMFKFEGEPKNASKPGQTVSFDVAQVLHIQDGKVNQIWAF